MLPDPAGTDTLSPRRRPGLGGWLMMAPLLAWLALFVIAPTAIMLVYSFSQRSALGEVVYDFTWENYQRVFQPELLRILGVSISIGAAVAAVVGGVLWAVARVWPWLDDRLYGGKLKGIVLTIFALVGWYILHRQVIDTQGGGNYLKIFVMSLEYAGVTTAVCVLVGYPVAYFIGRSSERVRDLLLMAVMIPFWTNFLIRTYAWVTILKREGLLNGLLVSMNVVPEPLEILYTPWAITIGLIYTYLPFMILPIYGSVEKLDNSLVEAAFDLGAGPVRAFSSVIVPLTRPGIVAGILLVFVPAVGQFAVSDVLGGRRHQLIGNVIERQFTAARNAPFGAALGIVLLLLFALAFLLLQRSNTPRDS